MKRMESTALLFVVGCVGTGAPAAMPPSRPIATDRAGVDTVGQVPAMPPDSVSAAFMDSVFAPSNLLSDGKGPSRVPKNILVVAFRPGSTVEAKAAAVQAVQGAVVGGYRLSADRYYYIRVPAVGNSESLGSFIDRLAAHPAVESATPLGIPGNL